MEKGIDYEKAENCAEKYAILKKNIYRKTLKPAGFRRYGGNFRIIKQSQIFRMGYLVSFCKIPVSVHSEIYFYVRIGRKSIFGDALPDDLSYKDCMISERKPLSVLADGRDEAYLIDNDTDMKKLEDRLCTLLKERAFGWFSM